MDSPSPPTTPGSPAASARVADVPPLDRPPSARSVALRLAAILIAALIACLVVYLAFAVPGRWFTDAQSRAWGPQDLLIAKGQARIVGDEVAVAPADASGLVVVSLKSSLKSSDYVAIEWIAIDVPDHMDVSLLWRSDTKPAQLYSAPLTVVSGRLLPTVTKDREGWLGTIEGLALAMKGPLSEPVRIRGVVAKASSAPEVLRERAREWFAFEAWTGTSINTVTGGADLQDLPLPLLLAFAVVVAALVVVALRRFRPSLLPASAFASIVALAVLAWLLLDLRWTANLVRQVDATAERYAGKSAVDKRLAVEDGPLFAFVQKAKEAMPDAPARVFVAADSDYFRGRAAYHLYPHNAFFLARGNAMPPRESLRPGDWMLVFNRRGVQFDAAQGRLRWDNQEPVAAELKLTGRGAALFVIR
jgi:hypothetical protein